MHGAVCVPSGTPSLPAPCARGQDAMRRLVAGGLGLSLGLWAAGVSAADPQAPAAAPAPPADPPAPQHPAGPRLAPAGRLRPELGRPAADAAGAGLRV